MKTHVTLCVFLILCCASLQAAVADDTELAKPATSALVVMDIQNIYIPFMDVRDTEPAFETINAAIELFRKHDLPIIRVYHTNAKRGPKPGTKDFAIPDAIRVRDDDPKVVKTYPSAFTKTELAALLKELGVDRVFLVGLSATGCVMATYWGAYDLDLEVHMVKGALISAKHELTLSAEEMTHALDLATIEEIISYGSS